MNIFFITLSCLPKTMFCISPCQLVIKPLVVEVILACRFQNPRRLAKCYQNYDLWYKNIFLRSSSKLAELLLQTHIQCNYQSYSQNANPPYRCHKFRILRDTVMLLESDMFVLFLDAKFNAIYLAILMNTFCRMK